MLSVESVDIGYKGQAVIKGLTLPPIGAGHVAALVGPNAAGKSTLLKAIAGAVSYHGEIRLSGAPLSGMTARERASKIAYMPQFSAGGSGLTVLEGVTATLAMGARQLGRAQAARRAVDVLEELGIGELALRPMNRLSGGQRQLASLAQALAIDPQVLLLDEPTSALDLGHQVRVMSLARRFAEKGRIVIAAVHDLALAAAYATQVIVMQQGRIAASGSPKDTITANLLADVYGVDAKVIVDDEGRLQIIILRESA